MNLQPNNFFFFFLEEPKSAVSRLVCYLCLKLLQNIKYVNVCVSSHQHINLQSGHISLNMNNGSLCLKE